VPMRRKPLAPSTPSGDRPSSPGAAKHEPRIKLQPMASSKPCKRRARHIMIGLHVGNSGGGWRRFGWRFHAGIKDKSTTAPDTTRFRLLKQKSTERAYATSRTARHSAGNRWVIRSGIGRASGMLYMTHEAWCNRPVSLRSVCNSSTSHR
jgi:hypothetical protein